MIVSILSLSLSLSLFNAPFVFSFSIHHHQQQHASLSSLVTRFEGVVNRRNTATTHPPPRTNTQQSPFSSWKLFADTTEENVKVSDDYILIDNEQETNTATRRVSIQRPLIHYTVPGFKVGWQDEEGNWFDEDGPRNGRPQNYWRQMSDENEYNLDMEALNAIMTEYDIEETVCYLEKKRSARFPSLNRKLLGSWAPILMGGKRLTFNDKPVDHEGMLEVPYTINIFRTNGRKYGPKNYYGIFDLKLQPGEDLTIEVVGGGDGDDDDNSIVFSSNTVADNANEPVLVGSLEEQKPLYFGGITYITDYVMVQRNPDGEIDFWLRVDNSYLGVNDPNVGIGEVKVE